MFALSWCDGGDFTGDCTCKCRLQEESECAGDEVIETEKGGERRRWDDV